MRHRQDLDGHGRMGSFLITTDDQTLFYCKVEEIGAPRQPRWVLIGTDRVRYIGPIWAPIRRLDDVQRLVNRWWEMKKGLGQTGLNAEILRDRMQS